MSDCFFLYCLFSSRIFLQFYQFCRSHLAANLDAFAIKFFQALICIHLIPSNFSPASWIAPPVLHLLPVFWCTYQPYHISFRQLKNVAVHLCQYTVPKNNPAFLTNIYLLLSKNLFFLYVFFQIKFIFKSKPKIVQQVFNLISEE